MPVQAPFFDPTTGQMIIDPPLLSRPTNPLNDEAYDPAQTEAGSMPSTSESGSSRDTAAREIHDLKKNQYLIRKLFRTDQRCFLSGSTGFRVKATHLVSTPETAPPGTPKKVKKLVEKYLTRLGFNGKYPFKLDGRSNLLLLAVEFHHGLDAYGDIAFLPSLDFLRELFMALHAANGEWLLRAIETPDAKRNLDMNKAPFNIDGIVWNVVVLHPSAFPSSQGLRIMRPHARTLKHIGGPPPAPSTSEDWHTYQVHSIDGVNFVADTDVEPPSRLELKFESIRAPEDQLSLFAMILVAVAKIRDFVESFPTDTAPPRSIIATHKILELIVAEIFCQPDGFADDEDYKMLVSKFSEAENAEPTPKPIPEPFPEDRENRGTSDIALSPAPAPEPEAC
ncbi:hypothetical protein MSAN_01873000 [Mycena sanguinolenta]|uniref:Uncharacterized protein n=1 Tax=Mycena sanguinolenta TaxID=230812 RepID=A0A8H7CQI1_9AGAR|nr:hypothetical protein MSAN_01873000 [Mycena sanguinolenta]